MKILLKTAKKPELLAFCEENGLDYGPILAGGGNPFAQMARLRALIVNSEMTDGETIEIYGDETPDAPAPTAAADDGEQLPEAVFQEIASALWTTAARKDGDKYLPAEVKIPEDRALAMRIAVAHRDATRRDPRNPFPGKAHGDTVTLMIPMQDPKHHSGGDLPVFVNFNESASQIARGEKVTVSWATAVALHHARADVMRQTGDNEIQKVGEIAQYPYVVMG